MSLPLCVASETSTFGTTTRQSSVCPPRNMLNLKFTRGKLCFAAALRSPKGLSLKPGESMTLLCPLLLRWPAQALSFSLRMACSHLSLWSLLLLARKSARGLPANTCLSSIPWGMCINLCSPTAPCVVVLTLDWVISPYLLVMDF